MQYVDYGLGFPWAAIGTGVASAAGSIWSAVTNKEETNHHNPHHNHHHNHHQNKRRLSQVGHGQRWVSGHFFSS